MRKITDPGEIQSELRRLIEYTHSGNPSRNRIASVLESLSDRLVGKQASAGTDALISLFDHEIGPAVMTAKKGAKKIAALAKHGELGADTLYAIREFEKLANQLDQVYGQLSGLLISDLG